MKGKLFFGLLFLIINQTLAQNDPWSIEANYSLVPPDGFFGQEISVELGVKYRITEVGFAKPGISLNGGYIFENSISYISLTDGAFFLQPRFFTEFELPFSERLKPHLGLGYSFVLTSPTYDGFNLNLGLGYDISKKWFIQSQYDYIHFRSVVAVNNIKIGLGYRF